MIESFWSLCTKIVFAHRRRDADEIERLFTAAELALTADAISPYRLPRRRIHLAMLRNHVGFGASEHLETDFSIENDRVNEAEFFPRLRNDELRLSLHIPADDLVVAVIAPDGAIPEHIELCIAETLSALDRSSQATTFIAPRSSSGINPKLDVDKSWIGVQDARPGTAVSELLAAADIILFPDLSSVSTSSTARRQLFECFAMGRPVVLGELPDGLGAVHGHDALILNPTDALQLGTAINKIRADPVLAGTLAEGAVKFYLNYVDSLIAQPVHEIPAHEIPLANSPVPAQDHKERGPFDHADKALPYKSHKGYGERLHLLEKKVITLEFEKEQLIERLRVMPSIDPLCLSDPTDHPDTNEREAFGIIVFGHTRLLEMEAVLESLSRQDALQFTEVWLDGFQGNQELKRKIERTIQLVSKYPVKRLHRQSGNFGFRKMLILGLIEMCKKYRDILVLEDDCFPTRNAVSEFRRELNLIRNDRNIFSVYGHHFLVEGERETCSRFQGWGWATTAEKLLPKLKQLIDCYSMSEENYLKFVRSVLTPAMKARIDVTPPRLPSYCLENFFAWDETLCLLCALDKQEHKPTAQRTIFNCGMGESSTHFQDRETFRNPPFNLITPSEVWNHF